MALALALLWVAVPALAKGVRLQLASDAVARLPIVASGPGTSGIATRMLHGNPAGTGPYTTAITVPPNTHIAAHSHREDRSAIVVSGAWHFGYGAVATDAGTKALPAGSFHTEPAG